MKKIMLLILLLVSSLIFCQSTGIKSIPEEQIPEIYKGLKQNEYLKVRLQKTEVALSSANELIIEQDKALIVGKTLINAKDEAMVTMKEISKQEKAAALERENQFKTDISILENNIHLMQMDAKEKQKNKYWKGVGTGVIGVALLITAGMILIK